MSKIASIDEITDILTFMPEVSYKLLRDDISATDLEHTVNLESLTQFFASSGDYISLAEHHLYGSSRLGVQKYESNTIANILNLPTPDEALVRTTLLNRQPWYSYPFADLIDSTKRSPYLAGSLTGNAYLGEWKTSRTLGSKYYEMTDHLGNVLATVLDRKTGVTTTASTSLYDHWAADLASTADYYPGGMMMPGRNTEYSWSRMGAQGSVKDDEVYGKGSFIDMGDRHLDTRIIRTPKTDKAEHEYPSISPYAYVNGDFINAIDPDGKRIYFVAGAGNDADGWNYVNRFAKILTQKGIQGFTRVNASGGAAKDIAFTAAYKNFSHVGRSFDGQLKRRDHKQIERAVNGIVADLAKRPLKEGEQLNLAGYSYGSVLQANVALQLADKGVKVDNLVLIGSPISDKSELYGALINNPNIGKVIRQDIPNDKLSNPKTGSDFKAGIEQTAPEIAGGMGDNAPHFDLARPGATADKKIGELGDKLKKEGVK